MENEYIIIQHGNMVWHIPNFNLNEEEDHVMENNRLEEPKHARWGFAGVNVDEQD